MYDSHKWNIWKIIIAVAASVYFFYSAHYYTEWQFLDSVNLIFHEAGHTFAIFFPTIIAVAAGTLLQLAIPIICTIHLYGHGHYYSSALMSFWIGQNLVEISLYAGDAVTKHLPLLGGENSIHDWNYMLTYFGLINQTSAVANTIFLLGIITIASASIYAILHAKDKLNPDTSRRYV